ncbi:Tudor/PWWP/MBT superfamily protein [Abeliophyllum distichum]|uniref:Tudor/PWWP/MBT superfamily protein n=1 Tax=Abeliophyllum distichum TaxID=126358 RepID=A0ABD1SH34_9LAMI
MATSQEIEAARKILAGTAGEIAKSSEAQMGGSGSKPEGTWGSGSEPEENRVKQTDLNRDDESVVVVTKRVVETEIVVESSLGELESGLGVEKNEENEVKIDNNASNVDVTDSVNEGEFNGNGNTLGVDVGGSWDDADGRERMFENMDGASPSAENGGVSGGDYKLLNGTVSDMDKNGGQTEEEARKVGVNGNTEIIDADNEITENEEKLVGQEHGFIVGDLVWGKIRSHPWWPGQIYNPLDASKFAEKHSHAGQVGRLLVAFFGDGSCSWCLPSQLIPFVENFEEMSKDGSSKSFFNAVQRSVDEVGRLLELNLTCKCIPEELKVGFSRPLVANAGIKDGVLVPEVDISRLSTPTYEPAELLARVRHIALAVSFGSMIEFVVLKSWLSAFYRSRGGGCLPVYCEPQEIEGLEDKSKNVDEDKSNNVDVVLNDFSVPIEVPIGPLEDDLPSSPTEGTDGTGNSAAPSHGRKQKSVAELMKENPEVKPKIKKRTTVTEGTDSGKSTSAKKSKGNDRGVEDGGNGGASSTLKKIVGKRKAVISESSKISENKVSNAASDVSGLDVKNDDPLLSRPKENNIFDEGNVTGEAIEASETVSSPRERKKSKYLSPPYTNLNWREGSSSFKRGTEIESEKNTKIAHVEDIAVEKLPNEQQKGLDTSDNVSEASEDTEKTTFTAAVDVSVTDMLSEIQFAAVDHIYLNKKSSLNVVSKFTSAFRSSVYLHGSNYKIFRKCQPGWKRKPLHSQLDNLENDLTQTKAKSSEPKSTKAGNQKKVAKSDTTRSKKADGISGTKMSVDKAERKSSLTFLILTFSPGFTMPSKDDIVRLFSKFGSLNETETFVVPDSHCAQVVYLNDSDAKEAFRSSINHSPFGAQSVNYKLQHSSAGSRSHGSHTRISSPIKRTPEKLDSSRRADDELSDVGIIRQKLETVAAMLENCSDKISPEDKSILKDELKSLLEKVERAVETVKKVVENTPS